MTTATDEFFKRKVQSEMVTIGKDRTLMIYRHIFTANVDASKQDCLKARGTRSAIFVCKATIFVCKAKEEELNPTINLSNEYEINCEVSKHSVFKHEIDMEKVREYGWT